ncbi:hypothetical protein [Auritidibacter ignavus]|uniref:hypothetical protein n=1 Tax=Auritidibacter ignavus TaxID=678932 RepID=UPI002FE5C6D4
MTEPVNEEPSRRGSRAVPSETSSERSPRSQRPSRREMRRRRQSRRRWILTGVIVLVILLIGIGASWLIRSGVCDGDDSPEASEDVSRNPSPGLDGVVATEVWPEDLEPGDCLTDFTDTESVSTIVDCDYAHDAQLVGRQILSEAETYPGADQMRTRADEFCAAIELTGSTDASVVTRVSSPSEASWNETGDRRIDCFVEAEESGALTNSLIGQPVLDVADDQNPSEQPSRDSNDAETTSEETSAATQEETSEG